MANEQLRRNRQNGRAHHPLCGCRNTQRVCRHVAHISQRLVARCGLHHLLDIHHLRKIPGPSSRRAQRSKGFLPLSLSDEYDANNRDNLINNLPTYLLSDVNNDDFLIFLSILMPLEISAYNYFLSPKNNSPNYFLPKQSVIVRIPFCS